MAFLAVIELNKTSFLLTLAKVVRQVILELLVLLRYLLADIVQPKLEQVAAVVTALLSLLDIRLWVIFHDNLLVLFFLKGRHLGNPGTGSFYGVGSVKFLSKFFDGSELLNNFGCAFPFISVVPLDGI